MFIKIKMSIFMLSESQVGFFLQANQDGLYIERLSKQEFWPQDHSDEVYKLIVDIGDLIKRADRNEILKISLVDWLKFLSLISLPRMILAIDTLERKAPQITRTLIDLDIERNDPSWVYKATFENRLRVLFNASLLNSVFSSGRGEAISKALEYYDVV